MQQLRVLNDFSLDAALVITCWLGLLNYWLGAIIPWWIYPWFAAWVWLTYTWDRLIDAYLQPELIKPQSPLFSLRHAQHWQYRKILLWVQGALAPLCSWGLISLPSLFWVQVPWLVGLCLIYMILTYMNKAHIRLSTHYILSASKHLIAALILSFGMGLIAIVYHEKLLFNNSWLLMLALVSYIFWINMRCCEYWDQTKKSPLVKSILLIEIISCILLLEITHSISLTWDYFDIALSFCATIQTILGSYLLLLCLPYAWIKDNRLFLADINLIICPLIILSLFLI